MEKDSRTKLIEAATDLFAEKGFAEVSTRELAKAAEVNSALIAYYFGGKEGLYEAVLETYFERIEERMAKTVMSHHDPIEKLRGFMANIATIHQEMPYLRKFISREFINPTPSVERILKKYIARFYNIYLEALNEVVEQGVIREDIIPEFVPIAMAGMVHFYYLAKPVIQQIVPILSDLDSDKIFIAQVKELCLNGLLRRKEGEG